MFLLSRRVVVTARPDPFSLLMQAGELEVSVRYACEEAALGITVDTNV